MFKFSNLKKPTPQKWQKIGRSLMRVSMFMSANAILADFKIAALIILVIGGIGEFITCLTADDDAR